MSEPHCEYLLLGCSDHRFTKKIIDWAEKSLGNSNYDLILIPGTQANIVDVVNRGTVIKWMRKLIGAHSVKNVVLMAHEDCLAYCEVGKEQINDRLFADLTRAKTLVEQNLSEFNLFFHCCYINLKGEVKTIKI